MRFSRIYLLFDKLSFLWQVAGVLLLTSALLYLSQNDDTQKAKHIQEIIQGNVYDIEKAANSEIQRLKTHIKNNTLNIDQVLRGYPYPHFVFENDSLLFWSTHNFVVPKTNLVNQKIIENHRGIFWNLSDIWKNEQGNTMRVHVFIPIVEDNSEYYKQELNYNEYLFPTQFAAVSLKPNENFQAIYDTKGTVLWFISIPKSDDFLSSRDIFLAFIMGLSAFILFFGLVRKSLKMRRTTRVREGFYLFILALLILRIFFLFLKGIPYFAGNPIFQPQVFASSVLSPSISDLFFNWVLFIFPVFYFIFYILRRFTLRKFIYRLKSPMQEVLIFLLGLLSYFTLELLHYNLSNILTNSRLALDITVEFSFPLTKILAMLTFLFASILYFFVAQITSFLIIKLVRSLWTHSLALILSSVVYYLSSVALNMEDILVFNVNTIYLLSITLVGFPLDLRYNGYKRIVYFLYCAMICSLVGMDSIVESADLRENVNKNKFANQLLIQNDYRAEYILNENLETMQKATALQQLFTEKAPAREIEKLVKTTYLDNYFARYRIGLSILRVSKKQPAKEIDSKFEKWRMRYQKPEFTTGYRSIFFVANSSSRTKCYHSFAHIKSVKGETLGYIIVEMEQKPFSQSGIYPFFSQPSKGSQNYSYALYKGQTLVSSQGEFNYEPSFLSLFQKKTTTFLDFEIEDNDFRHLRVPGERDKNIFITSRKYPLESMFTNFSFLLFIIVLFTSLCFLGYQAILNHHKRISISLVSKIQAYLNIALFLPLLVIIAVVVTNIIVTNTQARDSDYVNQTLKIAQLIQMKPNGEDKANVDQLIEDIKQFTYSDINIYSKHGKLEYTTVPYFFEKELLSPYLNPVVFKSVIQERKNKMLAEEYIMRVPFNGAYASLKDPQTGEVMGIVSVLFFDSKNEVKEQILKVISVVFRIFLFALILLLFLSYLSSVSLTKPLELITQKIRRTTLSDYNEPLEYNSKDEIGLLVGEYNAMLVKLEHSKEALKKTQEEEAWREIAKQLAHEIKNPITPIRLKLQQLERVLKGKMPNAEKVIYSILKHIDTLNDIATSFYLYTKLPVPKSKKIDLSSVVQSVVQLHKTDKDVYIDLYSPQDPCYIIADPSLIMGMINNLIINSIQAKREAMVQLNIYLKVEPSRCILEIQDNGIGIPEEVQDKIFATNFTSKSKGSGLGLAIVKRGVEHFGGSIWFRSVPNQGSQFFIELPRVNGV